GRAVDRRDDHGRGCTAEAPVIDNELDGVRAGLIKGEGGRGRRRASERRRAAGGAPSEGPLEGQWVAIGVARSRAIDMDGCPHRRRLSRARIRHGWVIHRVANVWIVYDSV